MMPPVGEVQAINTKRINQKWIPEKHVPAAVRFLCLTDCKQLVSNISWIENKHPLSSYFLYIRIVVPKRLDKKEAQYHNNNRQYSSHFGMRTVWFSWRYVLHAKAIVLPSKVGFCFVPTNTTFQRHIRRHVHIFKREGTARRIQI